MKKILSIILAVTMLLTMCPMAFATDTTDTTSEGTFDGYEYVFTQAAYGSDVKLNLAGAAGKTLENINTDESARWRLASISYIYGVNSSGKDLTYVGEDYFTFCGVRNWSDTSIAIELDVEQAGTYVPNLTYHSAGSGSPIVDVYLAKEGTTSGKKNPENFSVNDGGAIATGGVYAFTHHANNTYGLNEQEGIYALKKGLDMREGGTEDFGNIELTLEKKRYYLIIVFNNYGESLSPNPEMHLTSFSLTPVRDVVNDEFTPIVDNTTPVTNSASVQMYAYYGGKTVPLGEKENVTYGESVTVTAPEQSYTDAGTTYNFLYWTKGLENQIGENRQALSTALSFDYKPREGVNYLIAVYEEENADTEAFYNANGQLLTDVKITAEGKMPELPSMAGLGKAYAWVQLGNEETELQPGVDAPDGKRIFMAKYDESKATDSIMINNVAYDYNDEIVCKNIVTNYDADTFSYWARTINGVREIVSVDPGYSFHAFTDCTVEAVCVGKINVGTPRKILLSTFEVGDMTAVMAEFIGFGDAKEKGIMFDGQEIAMTTNKMQFTVTNDKTSEVTVTGYAVVDDQRITDGSIVVPGIPTQTEE